MTQSNSDTHFEFKQLVLNVIKTFPTEIDCLERENGRPLQTPRAGFPRLFVVGRISLRQNDFSILCFVTCTPKALLQP